MELWQIILIILASVFVGLLVGVLLSYLIARLQNKPFFIQSKRAVVVDEQNRQFAEEHEPTVIVEEESRTTTADLLTEVENNLKTATEPWMDRLLPFQVHAWDTNQDEINRLTIDLRHDLAQAYLDMKQANDIVWMATELGHRGFAFAIGYMKGLMQALM